MAVTDRLPLTLLTAAMSLGAGVAGMATEAPPLAAVAWGLLAAVGLSLMLRRFGLWIIGALIITLALLGAGMSLFMTPWVAVLFVGVGISGVLMVIHGPGRRAGAAKRTQQADLWQQMDAGEDPTA